MQNASLKPIILEKNLIKSASKLNVIENDLGVLSEDSDESDDEYDAE